MSNLITSPTITIQRDKNQITIPSVIAKQIKVKKGTKYTVSINKNGDVVLKVIKNDIRKYIGILQSEKSAMAIIREVKMEEERSLIRKYS